MAQEVKAEDAEGGEVTRGVAEAGAAGIFTEDDVEAPVAFLDLLKVGLPCGGDVAHDCADNALMCGMICLKGQNVVPFVLRNRLNGGGLCIERIGRDNVPLEIETLQKLGDMGDFVAL